MEEDDFFVELEEEEENNEPQSLLAFLMQLGDDAMPSPIAQVIVTIDSPATLHTWDIFRGMVMPDNPLHWLQVSAFCRAVVLADTGVAIEHRDWRFFVYSDVHVLLCMMQY